ncbi:MAG: helix-turn-helix transcriptional regulator [Alphaproteobacteria bacterium]|nr:helix-turn-helix transcriptional regulator [Alphaproteobacteria bacterium]
MTKLKKPVRKFSRNISINDIDREIGRRIQELRMAKGLSRQQLADKVGVTHQQLQKYEKGSNRIAASRLAAISSSLGVEVRYFFENHADGNTVIPDEHQRMCLEVARNFMRIRKPLYQDAVNALIRILAEA